MEVRFASPEDNDRLLAFFNQFIFGGSVELKLQRPKSFFAPYQIQSDQYSTFILEDEASEIHGCVTFFIQDVMLAGQKRRVAFARDLRISQNRQAILTWGEKFLPVIQQLKE